MSWPADRSPISPSRREADPQGLLNPGKMLRWDDPRYTGTDRQSHLAKSLRSQSGNGLPLVGRSSARQLRSSPQETVFRVCSGRPFAAHTITI
jgi:hypothetical protein